VLSGPEVGFLIATFVVFAVWAVSYATLAPDAVMPIVASAFLVLGAAFALFAWRRRGSDAGPLTYLDAAGALMLIGFGAAVMIDSDQLMRLVASHADN
jgi:hypothetical protein